MERKRPSWGARMERKWPQCLWPREATRMGEGGGRPWAATCLEPNARRIAWGARLEPKWRSTPGWQPARLPPGSRQLHAKLSYTLNWLARRPTADKVVNLVLLQKKW